MDATFRRKRTFAVLTILGLLAGFGWAWGSRPFRLKDQLLVRRFAAVEPGKLYRSGQISPRLIERTLRKHDIRVVIDLNSDSPGPDAAREARRAIVRAAEMAAAKRLGIRRVETPLHGDGTGEYRFREAARALAVLMQAYERGETVLVHCSAGKRRSAVVVSTFQLLIQGRPPSEAYRELERFLSRDEALELARILNQHMRELAGFLVAEDVLDHVPEPLPQFSL